MLISLRRRIGRKTIIFLPHSCALVFCFDLIWLDLGY